MKVDNVTVETRSQVDYSAWNVDRLQAIVGRLSEPSKMPCFGYALPATSCHIGGILRGIKGSICSKCYGHKGRYAMPMVKRGLKKRLASLSHPDWADLMVALIKRREKNGYFRWHDSGDLQSTGHLAMICRVAERLPGILFWLPTKERLMVREYLKGNNIPPNLTVRLSAHMIGKTIQQGDLLSFSPNILTCSSGAEGPAAGHQCTAYEHDGKCGSCRACWDVNVKNVNYPMH